MSLRLWLRSAALSLADPSPWSVASSNVLSAPPPRRLIRLLIQASRRWSEEQRWEQLKRRRDASQLPPDLAWPALYGFFRGDYGERHLSAEIFARFAPLPPELAAAARHLLLGRRQRCDEAWGIMAEIVQPTAAEIVAFARPRLLPRERQQAPFGKIERLERYEFLLTYLGERALEPEIGAFLEELAQCCEDDFSETALRATAELIAFCPGVRERHLQALKSASSSTNQVALQALAKAMVRADRGETPPIPPEVGRQVEQAIRFFLRFKSGATRAAAVAAAGQLAATRPGAADLLGEVACEDPLGLSAPAIAALTQLPPAQVAATLQPALRGGSLEGRQRILRHLAPLMGKDNALAATATRLMAELREGPGQTELRRLWRRYVRRPQRRQILEATLDAVRTNPYEELTLTALSLLAQDDPQAAADHGRAQLLSSRDRPDFERRLIRQLAQDAHNPETVAAILTRLNEPWPQRRDGEGVKKGKDRLRRNIAGLDVLRPALSRHAAALQPYYLKAAGHPDPAVAAAGLRGLVVITDDPHLSGRTRRRLVTAMLTRVERQLAVQDEAWAGAVHRPPDVLAALKPAAAREPVIIAWCADRLARFPPGSRDVSIILPLVAKWLAAAEHQTQSSGEVEVSRERLESRLLSLAATVSPARRIAYARALIPAARRNPAVADFFIRLLPTADDPDLATAALAGLSPLLTRSDAAGEAARQAALAVLGGGGSEEGRRLAAKLVAKLLRQPTTRPEAEAALAAVAGDPSAPPALVNACRTYLSSHLSSHVSSRPETALKPRPINATSRPAPQRRPAPIQRLDFSIL